jgi:hypothetical protein
LSTLNNATATDISCNTIEVNQACSILTGCSNNNYGVGGALVAGSGIFGSQVLCNSLVTDSLNIWNATLLPSSSVISLIGFLPIVVNNIISYVPIYR